MWWSRALICVTLLVAGPVGCGFQPVYARPDGAPSAVAEQLASVRVAAIDDRIGQQLRNGLVSTLSPRGEPASPDYLLTVQMTEVIQGLATSKDGTASIGNVVLTAIYTLRDARTNHILYSNSARSFSGYRYLGPRYASTVSERESRSSALSEIAAEIRGALVAHFSNAQAFPTQQTTEPAFVPYQPFRDTPLGEVE